MYKMSYDRALENDAQILANQCPTTGANATILGAVGENFATIPSTTLTYREAVIQAVRTFWREIKATSMNRRARFTLPLKNKINAPIRFSQMAWASTYRVGCGAMICPQNNNTVVVCRYAPRGNIINSQVYNRGPACNLCRSSCTNSSLHRGLCTAPAI
ncbi:hypothetical protein GCK32_006494 [Trichostrongylus colubriformis]|uniref:SCP domain-containing protein n=1 Tax=Trichostrongylus colubriformis TaxID=6319 RepID=A0AAN8EXB5_TRICO